MSDEEEQTQLFLAMPRRELFRHTGFVTRIDMAVLSSLAEEHWYTAPQLLASNHDAKEVRLGLIITRPGEVLVGDGGMLLHRSRIPPEAGDLSQGLGAFKNLALGVGRNLLGLSAEAAGRRVELRGYLNEEANPICRGILFLVYRMQVDASVAAPANMQWMPLAGFDASQVEEISRMVVPALS
jgi:hypothetical protein